MCLNIVGGSSTLVVMGKGKKNTQRKGSDHCPDHAE